MTALHDPFRNPTALNPNWKLSPITGGAAGNLTLTGIKFGRDHLLAVLVIGGTSAAAAGTISQVTGTNTAIVTGFAANSYVVLAGDDTANTVSIPHTLGGAPDAFGVMILRGGVRVLDDAALSAGAANLVVADGATYVLTAGDVIHWWARRAAAQSLTATFTGSTPTFTGSAPVQTLAVTNLTSQFTVTADNVINNTGGTSTAGKQVLIIWSDYDYGAKVDAPWNV